MAILRISIVILWVFIVNLQFLQVYIRQSVYDKWGEIDIISKSRGVVGGVQEKDGGAAWVVCAVHYGWNVVGASRLIEQNGG